jgi:hypothetical protein
MIETHHPSGQITEVVLTSRARRAFLIQKEERKGGAGPLGKEFGRASRGWVVGHLAWAKRNSSRPQTTPRHCNRTA